MTAALQALQDQYDLLTTNLPNLLDACQGDVGKMNAINTQYAASQANYTKCINKIFDDNDSSVQTLVGQMEQEQAALTSAFKHIGAIAGVITAITTAVQTGAALAAKV
jgi:predicted PurR-regulated permease PerM